MSELFFDFKYIPLGLLAAALAVFGYALWRKRRHSLMARMFSESASRELIGKDVHAARKTRAALFTAGVFLLFAALAGPQWGIEITESPSQLTQAVFAVDTSLSMLAADIKPSRLESARLCLSMLIDQLKELRAGVIAFSGRAYIQCPLTTDTEALKYFVRGLKAGMLPQAGTSIGNAIDLCVKMLSGYSGKKALILITDGEDHGSGLQTAVENAAKNGIVIFAVGIGKPEGEPIPVGKSDSGTEYKKDREGKIVISRLGEKTLLDMAKQTGGAYIRYTDPAAVAAALDGHIAELGKSSWKGTAASRYKNRYLLPLGLAFLLLLIEFILPENRLATAGARTPAGREETLK